MAVKFFTLTNFDIAKIASANFVFADGSKLQIGDGTSGTTADNSANAITGTEGDDYLDGRSGSDTVSYASAASGVTVDLGNGGVRIPLAQVLTNLLASKTLPVRLSTIP